MAHCWPNGSVVLMEGCTPRHIFKQRRATPAKCVSYNKLSSPGDLEFLGRSAAQVVQQRGEEDPQCLYSPRTFSQTTQNCTCPRVQRPGEVLPSFIPNCLFLAGEECFASDSVAGNRETQPNLCGDSASQRPSTAPLVPFRSNLGFLAEICSTCGAWTRDPVVIATCYNFSQLLVTDAIGLGI
jgi:hypothetical protein